MLTIKLANLLESKGKSGSVFLIDGSPQFLHRLSNMTIADKSDENIQALVILPCIRLLFPQEFEEIANKVFSETSSEARLKTFIDIGVTRSQYSAEYGNKMLNAIIKRIKICLKADEIEFEILKFASINLIKPTNSSINDLDEDYGLGKYFKNEVKIATLEGDHASILRNPEFKNILNK